MYRRRVNLSASPLWVELKKFQEWRAEWKINRSQFTQEAEKWKIKKRERERRRVFSPDYLWKQNQHKPAESTKSVSSVSFSAFDCFLSLSVFALLTRASERRKEYWDRGGRERKRARMPKGDNIMDGDVERGEAEEWQLKGGGNKWEEIGRREGEREIARSFTFFQFLMFHGCEHNNELFTAQCMMCIQDGQCLKDTLIAIPNQMDIFI